jgi:phosphatidylserine/phosphatidylglycerophosphate/cardiolipin synthase-like enzyme
MSQEALAEVIASIAGNLPDMHIASWCEVLTTASASDQHVEAALIDVRPGDTVAAEARRLMTAWRTEAPAVPGVAVALALASAAKVHQQAASHRTQLVVSGPVSPSVSVRLTSSVVVEVIRAARASLLVVSFAAYGVPEVVAELLAATRRGVHVHLILESSTGDGGALRGATGASAAFARLRDRAIFWHWPAHRRQAAGNPRAAMHAKIITVDDSAALITSANLTDRAMSSNLEVGVVLRDPEPVRRLIAHFTALMDPRTGSLERLS